jgi:hypothetical protein
MPARREGFLCRSTPVCGEDLLYVLKAGPAGATAYGGRPRPAKTRLRYLPLGRLRLLGQQIGKVNLKKLPHRREATRDWFSGQMLSVGRQALIIRRDGRRLGPLPL